MDKPNDPVLVIDGMGKEHWHSPVHSFSVNEQGDLYLMDSGGFVAGLYARQSWISASRMSLSVKEAVAA